MEMLNVDRAAAYLRTADDCLIYIHTNPDGDAVGSGGALALALRRLGKRARVFCADEIPERLRFLTEAAADVPFTRTQDASATPLSVDVASAGQLRRARSAAFRAVDRSPRRQPHRLRAAAAQKRLSGRGRDCLRAALRARPPAGPAAGDAAVRGHLVGQRRVPLFKHAAADASLRRKAAGDGHRFCQNQPAAVRDQKRGADRARKGRLQPAGAALRREAGPSSRWTRR